MSSPAFVDYVSNNGITAGVTYNWPNNHQVDDLGILTVETSGDGATLTTPSGWTAFTGSPYVDVATTAGSKLHVWWKRATSTAEAGVAVGASSNHQGGAIRIFRGVRNTGDPYDIISNGSFATASTTFSIPALTTTSANNMYMLFMTNPADQTSSDLTSFTCPAIPEINAWSSGTTSGNGGVVSNIFGVMTTAGSTGGVSIARGTANTTTYVHFALVPQISSSTVVSYPTRHTYNDVSTTTLSAATMWIGNWSGNSENGAEWYRSINIPKGALITGASVGFDGIGHDGTGSVSLNIKAIAQGNPAWFTDYTDYTGRARTTASFSWTAPVNTATWDGSIQIINGFTSVIQELVNRSDWVSGNDIILLYENNGSPSGVDVRVDYGFLNITYLPPGSSNNMIMMFV